MFETGIKHKKTKAGKTKKAQGGTGKAFPFALIIGRRKDGGKKPHKAKGRHTLGKKSLHKPDHHIPREVYWRCHTKAKQKDGTQPCDAIANQDGNHHQDHDKAGSDQIQMKDPSSLAKWCA